MKIKQDVIDKIKENRGLRKILLSLLGVSRTTLWKYLEENDDNLTKASPLKAIADHYNLTTDEILDEATIAA